MSAFDIFLALAFAVVIDIACDWLTRLSGWIVGRAARTLPRKYRSRYVQEWKAELEYRPRLLRIFFAVDLFRAARSIRREAFKRQGARKIAANPARSLAIWRGKRLFDILIASSMLVVVAPFMVFLALLVKLTSPGPVMFKQRRYGLDGREILIYKFRTMTVMEDSAAIQQATAVDSRITPLGRILRRTSLDDLPQLLNVLQGRMTIVGPRPHVVAHGEQYRKLIGGLMRGRRIRPGLVGLAQVSGLRGEAQTIEQMKTRVKYDAVYLKSASLWLDLKILWRAIITIITDPKPSGASTPHPRNKSKRK